MVRPLFCLIEVVSEEHFSFDVFNVDIKSGNNTMDCRLLGHEFSGIADPVGSTLDVSMFPPGFQLTIGLNFIEQIELLFSHSDVDHELRGSERYNIILKFRREPIPATL